ncbi:hypothetical protein R5W24_001897 [Gemmata sp. JC717]|uniref:hypothetical protein n=1 Tax=Gemmata algarum TaxID=2975278 RepID=UPI0021BB4538|nr:hypothetical protein [Gemmata algarum]MDY3552808.1 hypothetical protein [Gemmata algarum]
MTEAEWLACDDPRPLFFAFVGRYSRRKVLLFSVAGCAECQVRFTDERCWSALEVVERFADGLALPGEVDFAVTAADEARRSAYNTPEWSPGLRRMRRCSTEAACALLAAVGHANSRASFASAVDAVEFARQGVKGGKSAQARLLRDVFGNPFRPAPFPPSWLTSDVQALARGIYEERAFDRLSILADALQDTGCDNADILDHCRGSGPHVRGCWVVDLVLGKQ